jgi:hypothetical protein
MWGCAQTKVAHIGIIYISLIGLRSQLSVIAVNYIPGLRLNLI